MTKELIECPDDPHKKYLREICSNIFQKSNSRPWCRKCHYFHHTDSAAPTAEKKRAS